MMVHPRYRMFGWCLLCVLGVGTLIQAQQPSPLQLPFGPERIPVPEPNDVPLPLRPPNDMFLSPDAVVPSSRRQRSRSQVGDAMADVQRDRNRRMDRIREKLERLRKLAAEACRDPTVADLEVPEATDPVETVEPAPPDPLPPTVIPPPVETPESAPQPPVTIPVTSTTVDTLALANNLFAQGKASQARPLYEQLIQLPQEALDLLWIQFQLASCYRLEGNLKQAKKLYRLVAGTKGEDYWSSRAQWWLNYMARAEELRKRQQAIQETLDSLRKEADAFKP